MTAVVRRATVADRGGVVETAVLAFEGDAAIRTFFPDDATYRTQAAAFYSYLFDKRIGGGEIWMTDGCEAISIWEDPAGVRLSDEAVAAAWRMAERGMGEGAATRLHRYDRTMDGLVPDHPYWYLGVLAVHPDHRGRGLSRAVVRPVQLRADKAGVPLLLETSEPDNVRLYEHFGFRTTAEFAVTSDVAAWIMERPIGAGAGW